MEQKVVMIEEPKLKLRAQLLQDLRRRSGRQFNIEPNNTGKVRYPWRHMAFGDWFYVFEKDAIGTTYNAVAKRNQKLGRITYATETKRYDTGGIGVTVTRLDVALMNRWGAIRRLRKRTVAKATAKSAPAIQMPSGCVDSAGVRWLRKETAIVVSVRADTGVTVDDIQGKPVDNTATPG